MHEQLPARTTTALAIKKTDDMCVYIYLSQQPFHLATSTESFCGSLQNTYKVDVASTTADIASARKLL